MRILNAAILLLSFVAFHAHADETATATAISTDTDTDTRQCTLKIVAPGNGTYIWNVCTEDYNEEASPVGQGTGTKRAVCAAHHAAADYKNAKQSGKSLWIKDIDDQAAGAAQVGFDSEEEILALIADSFDRNHDGHINTDDCGSKILLEMVGYSHGGWSVSQAAAYLYNHADIKNSAGAWVHVDNVGSWKTFVGLIDPNRTQRMGGTYKFTTHWDFGEKTSMPVGPNACFLEIKESYGCGARYCRALPYVVGRSPTAQEIEKATEALKKDLFHGYFYGAGIDYLRTVTSVTTTVDGTSATQAANHVNMEQLGATLTNYVFSRTFNGTDSACGKPSGWPASE